MNRRRRVTAQWLSERSEAVEKEEQEQFLLFFFFMLTSALHVLLFISVVFDSLVPTIPLLIVYILGTIALALYYKKRGIRYWGWRAYFIFPTVLNLLLTINYFISWPAGQETYPFNVRIEQVANNARALYATGTNSQATTLIILDSNKYHEYPGIRFFSSVEKFRGLKKVTYYFNRGILGIRSVHDYKFHF